VFDVGGSAAIKRKHAMSQTSNSLLHKRSPARVQHMHLTRLKGSWTVTETTNLKPIPPILFC